MTFLWHVLLNEKRLKGRYRREAEFQKSIGNNYVVSIKTEKGKITITADELRSIIKHFDKILTKEKK